MTQAMRILLTSDFFRPFIGGAERQVELLAHALAARGHDVAVATVWQGAQPIEEVDGDVSIHRLTGLATRAARVSSDPGRRYHPPAPDPSIVMGLRRLRRTFRPDIVHANGWIGYSCAAALSRASARLVLSVRDYGYSCAIRTLMEHDVALCSGPALRKCLSCSAHHYGGLKGTSAVLGVLGGRMPLGRRIDGVHSVSTFVESIVRRDLLGHVGRRVVETIPDIVSVPALDTASADDPAVSRLPSEPFLLFVGALQAHKGIGILLEAYARLPEDARPPLVLIGTRWPDTPDSFPPGVTILESVPHAVVIAAWRRALFGILPSVWPDPLPGTVREAMSQERAVIATAVGGNLDMVDDGRTGLLVPPGDPVALANAIGRLLDDPDLRGRLAVAGRRSLDGLDAASVALRFERFYRAILARSGSHEAGA